MNYKSLITAVAVASLPMTASAASLLVNGGTTDPTALNTTYQFLSLEGTEFTHTFVIDQDGAGVAALSFDSLVESAFSNLNVTWYAGADTSGSIIGTGVTEASALIAAGAATLVVSAWESTDPGQIGTIGSVQISAVPVPAGLLLMGTAMAGLGVMRRKK